MRFCEWLVALTLTLGWSVGLAQTPSAANSASAGPSAGEVSLTVCERGGSASANRDGDIATGGVPFPEAAAITDLTQLRVLDAAGQVLPAQFLPLDRWQAAAGKPVRWCLVSFPATVKAGGDAKFTLKLAGKGLPQPPAAALKVTDAPDAVTVVTGPLKFRVSKKSFNLFDGVWLDATGQFGADTEVVPTSAGGTGAVLTTGDWPEEGLKAGDRFSSAAGPAKVTIEESGPVRACIFIQGQHGVGTRSSTYAGPGVYDYKVRIYAYAGQPYVRVFYTLANSRVDSVMRTWPIQSLSLMTKLAGGVKSVKLPYDKGAEELDLQAGDAVALVQTVDDSKPQSKAAKGSAPTAAITRGKQAEGKPAGERAPGTIDVSGEKFGVAVGMKYFSQMCPKGLAADKDGVSVELFPKTDKAYYLLPGRKRVHELVYLFHAAKDAKAPLAAVAALKDQELRPVAAATWYQSSRAWFGGMGIVDPAICPHAQTPAIDPTGLYSTWYGYGFFGRDWNSGGQHPHHDSVSWPWVLGGGSDQARYVEAEALCRWIADLGVGSVMDLPTDYSVLNKEQWANKKLNDIFMFMGTSSYDNADARFKGYRLDLTYKTYPGGPTKLESGGAYEPIKAKIDSGHMGLIGLHEFYRLTGDRDVLETMDAAATISRSLMRIYVCPPAIKMFVEKDNPEDPAYKTQDRYIGWPLYEIAEAYSRTGNPVFAKEASVIVRAMRNRLRTCPVGFLAMPTPATPAGKKPDGYGPMVAAGPTESASQVDAVFQTGIAANGLARYTVDTGDFEGLDTLTAFADNVCHFSMTTEGDKMKGWWYVWSDYWTPGGPTSHFDGFGASAVRVYRPLAEAYNLTGRADYRAVSTAAVETLNPTKKMDPNMGLEMQGFMYPQQCPKPGPAPAAVKDLKAEAVGGGQVKLTWTAPAQAARYQVKYSADPIVERVTGWPDRTPPLPQNEKEWEAKSAAFMAKNGRPFWSAVNAPGSAELSPHAAGAVETLIVKDLKPGKLHFALKAYDAAHDQSELSNVIEVQVK